MLSKNDLDNIRFHYTTARFCRSKFQTKFLGFNRSPVTAFSWISETLEMPSTSWPKKRKRKARKIGLESHKGAPTVSGRQWNRQDSLTQLRASRGDRRLQGAWAEPARRNPSEPSAHPERSQPARAPQPQAEAAKILPSPRRTQRGRGRSRHITRQTRVKQRDSHSA